jgi:hypothetical protein
MIPVDLPLQTVAAVLIPVGLPLQTVAAVLIPVDLPLQIAAAVPKLLMAAISRRQAYE